MKAPETPRARLVLRLISCRSQSTAEHINKLFATRGREIDVMERSDEVRNHLEYEDPDEVIVPLSCWPRTFSAVANRPAWDAPSR